MMQVTEGESTIFKDRTTEIVDAMKDDEIRGAASDAEVEMDKVDGGKRSHTDGS